MRLCWSVAAAALLLSAAVLAGPKIQIEFTKHVKPAEGSALAKAGCVACHVAPAKAELNAYGKDMAAAMKALETKELTKEVLAKLAKLDSDKDKFTNEQELKAGTLPGDPKSKPKSKRTPRK